jgi:GNAT superfamily N-acetyltransferase
VIRPIVEDDWGDWKALWEGYLHFYRRELSEATSRSTFARLCRKADGMFGFVATSDTSLTGFAHALLHPSTWSTEGYCYLEDLFVAPAARGAGVGQALIEAVVGEGRRRHASRIYWHTQEFNGPARSLYDQLAHRTSFIVYQCP